MTTTTGSRWTSGQLETALLRTTIGDHLLEAGLHAVLCHGPGLPAMLAAGLIVVEPDVDELGGGWWATVAWSDVDAALTGGRLTATWPQASVLRAVAGAAGRLPTGGSPEP